MQHNSKIADDMAKLMAGIFAGSQNFKSEMEKDFRNRVQSYFSAEWVGREEFDVFRQLLQRIAEQQELILQRLDGLEKQMGKVEKPVPSKKVKTATSKATKPKA